MKDEYEIQRAYTHAQQDISTLIDWLECELEQKPENINWGHVGNLKNVRSNLLETLAFVSGFDHKIFLGRQSFAMHRNNPGYFADAEYMCYSFPRL